MASAAAENAEASAAPQPLNNQELARLNNPGLLHKLSYDSILIRCMSKTECITVTQKSEVDKKTSNEDRLEALMFYLKRRSSEHFSTFIECLIETDQFEAADLLFDKGTGYSNLFLSCFHELFTNQSCFYLISRHTNLFRVGKTYSVRSILSNPCLPRNALGSLYTAYYSIRPTHAQHRLRVYYVIVP